VTTLRAFVALKGGGSSSDRVRAELLATAKEKLTWYKVPEDVGVRNRPAPHHRRGSCAGARVRAMAAAR